MNVYERLAAATTPKSITRSAVRTTPAGKQRPNTTTSRNRLFQSPISHASRDTGPAHTSNGKHQKPTLAKSKSQSSIRRIKSVNNGLRPGTAPLGTLSPSKSNHHINTQVDKDAATITILARAIEDADYILIGAGAGFSADSGLAVYKDIARVPAYDLMGVDYATLCDPIWLQRSPEIFYGFWGHCFNSYRDTTPHEGYTIIKNIMTAYPDKQIYIYSSNVDSHFEKIGISRKHIYEFHGTCIDWQCSRSCQLNSIYRLPFQYRFTINTQTMRCSAENILYNAKNGHNTLPNSPSPSPHLPRPPPVLSMRKKPGQNLSVFSQLYSSYYGDNPIQDISDCSQITSTLLMEDSTPHEPDSVLSKSNVNMQIQSTTATNRASPLLKNIYNRVYSQGSRSSHTRGALHDALANQGIDYSAIKHEAKRVCSVQLLSTFNLVDDPVYLCKKRTKTIKDPPKADNPIEQQSLSSNKEIQIEDQPLTKQDASLPSTIPSTNKDTCGHSTKHDPEHIESSYKKIYESVRPIASQNDNGYPTCPHCKYYLRPRVLMFDDTMFMEISEEEQRYNSFKRKLLRNKGNKVCLLEIGCGLRIPTIRHELDSILRRCAKNAIPCSLFRINPEKKRVRTASSMGSSQFYHIAQGGKDVMIQLANILNISY